MFWDFQVLSTSVNGLYLMHNIISSPLVVVFRLSDISASLPNHFQFAVHHYCSNGAALSAVGYAHMFECKDKSLGF